MADDDEIELVMDLEEVARFPSKHLNIKHLSANTEDVAIKEEHA